MPILLVIGFAAANLSPHWLLHLSDSVVVDYIANTLYVGIEAILVALLLAAAPAWLTHFFEFKGRRIASFLQLLPLTIPAFLLAAIYIQTSHHPFFQSREILGIEIGSATAPWIFLFLRVALVRIPQEFTEIARTFGLSTGQRVLKIYLPLLFTSLLVGCTLVFVQSVGDYGAADMVGISTYSVGLYNQWLSLQRNDVGLAMACLPILTAILIFFLILFVFPRRGRAGSGVGYGAGAATGSAGLLAPITRRRLTGRNAFVANFVCIMATAFNFLIPCALCLAWSIERFGYIPLSSLYSDALSSLLTSFSVMALALFITLLFARFSRIGERTGTPEKATWLVILNFLLPPLVMALVLLKFGTWLGTHLGHPDDEASLFTTTRLSIVLAQSGMFLPLMLLPVTETLARLPAALKDSALTLGLSQNQTFFRAILPQLKIALAAGGILVFVLSLTELTMTLLLQPFGYQALVLRIFSFTTTMSMHSAALWVLISVMICSYPIWALSAFLETRGRIRA